MATAALSSANAQSLKVRKGMAEQEKMLVEHVESLNKSCGTTIAVKFDWKDAPAADLEKYSASLFCDAALSGIRRTCANQIGKDAVKQKVKSVTCGFGPKRAISLKDGLVDYKINFSTSNDTDFVYEFMQNNL
ncbi:MAG: hypothetical protein P8Y36_07855 [Alphaproteobacteria bacterium]